MSESEEAKIIRDYEKTKEKILDGLDEYFTPEFINRIDKIVVFSPLDKTSMGKIIRLQLAKLIERLALIGISCLYDTKVVNFIAKATYDPSYGARGVRRYIQEKIEDEIADRLIQNEKPVTISLGIHANQLSFDVSST